jgi:site-specific recombinase XerD
LLDGKDPGVEKKLQARRDRAARANTFGAVAEDYLDKQAREGKAAVTIKKSRWVFGFARAALWEHPIAEITSVEILECLRVIERRGTLETARRMRSTIGSVFRFGIAEGKVADDPTRALRGALAAPTVKSQAAITDPKRFGELLRGMD